MSINSMVERGETGFSDAKVKYAQRWQKYAQQTIKYAQQVKKYAQQPLKYDSSRKYIEENGAAQIPWALRFFMALSFQLVPARWHRPVQSRKFGYRNTARLQSNA